MLTIEVKVNGRLVGRAQLITRTNLSEVSDYSLEWSEAGGDVLLDGKAHGRTVIRDHRRKSGCWVLVARAAAAILGQKVKAMEDGQ